MNTDSLTAYKLVEKKTLKDINAKGCLLSHVKTGARVLALECDDENKVFSVAFRTPPADSKGSPHIMEHSVLCGSKSFPVKDPFVELAKGSLNTFLNAMTYPDKTVYPVASRNDKDFQNLMHVYLDAVFYPNIYRHSEIFRQEGFSLRLDEPDGEPYLNGVVYNEMKGAFSSPEESLERKTLEALFPDTAYANESGGDPDKIPELTYEEFLDFHRRYYHPSNSYIYLYGDMDMNEKLNWMDEHYLSHFDRTDIDSAIALQRPFSKVRDVRMTYPVAEDEDIENKTYLSYSKVVATSLDKDLYQAFQVLDFALLSAPAAPLRKALIDAGIGDDILGGYDNGIYQPVFTVTAKGASEEQKDDFVAVIEDTLRGLVRDGIDKKALLAAVNSMEFRYREADFGSYPKGLVYLLEIFDSWLYDDNAPFLHLQASDSFNFMRERIEREDGMSIDAGQTADACEDKDGSRKSPGYFESLIEKYLLNNTHGAVITSVPERGLEKRLERKLMAKLSAYKASLGADGTERLVRETRELTAYQESEDRREDIEKIPVLNVSDISRKISPPANEEIECDGTEIIFHEIETNGIAYVSLIFDVTPDTDDKAGNIKSAMLPYLGILQNILTFVDTADYGYGELYNEINIHTGGIGTSLEVYPDADDIAHQRFKATLEVRAKTLYGQLPFAFDMMREIITGSKFDDKKRLRELISMLRSRLQMSFQSSGHMAASLRALSYVSPVSEFRDLVGGISFYETLKYIDEHFEECEEELTGRLLFLMGKIFTRDNMTVSCTAARSVSELLIPEVKKLAYALRVEKAGSDGILPGNKAGGDNSPAALTLRQNEGFQTASKVQYVARAGCFSDKGFKYTGSMLVLKVIMAYEYLWQNVRVKGGAYGCMSNFSRFGCAYLVSYRDPHLKNTLTVFENIPRYLRDFDASDREMAKYIIGAVSDLDQPLTPSARGEHSMWMYLTHTTEEMLIREREEVLNTGAADIRSLADPLSAVLSDNCLCVIGREEKIRENAGLFGDIRSLY